MVREVVGKFVAKWTIELGARYIALQLAPRQLESPTAQAGKSVGSSQDGWFRAGIVQRLRLYTCTQAEFPALSDDQILLDVLLHSEFADLLLAIN